MLNYVKVSNETCCSCEQLKQRCLEINKLIICSDCLKELHQAVDEGVWLWRNKPVVKTFYAPEF